MTCQLQRQYDAFTLQYYQTALTFHHHNTSKIVHVGWQIIKWNMHALCR